MWTAALYLVMQALPPSSHRKGALPSTVPEMTTQPQDLTLLSFTPMPTHLHLASMYNATAVGIPSPTIPQTDSLTGGQLPSNCTLFVNEADRDPLMTMPMWERPKFDASPI